MFFFMGYVTGLRSKIDLFDPDPDPVKETERVRIRNSELLYMHHLFPRR